MTAGGRSSAKALRSANALRRRILATVALSIYSVLKEFSSDLHRWARSFCEQLREPLTADGVVSMEERCDVKRRRLLALLGSGAVVTIGGAATRGETGLPGKTGSATGDSGNHDPLTTRLTREYGVRYPFVSAGMGFVSYPPLVTAVSNAGGIGVLGNAIEPAPSTQQLIRMIAAGTRGLFGVES